MADKKKPLKFASLIRVSTEKQAEQGESLQTQQKDNAASVKLLGGKIVEQYGGQEHATPDWEHKEVDRLLRDAQRKKFDAVIVYHPLRWSRDNKKSKEGLEILRRNGVRFFVKTMEYNLYEPNSRLFLGMSAEIGEWTASVANQQSMLNKIERAKKGVPVTGRLPAGRTYNKKTDEWGIDKAFQRKIEEAARRYVAGESMAELAVELGIKHCKLHYTLTKRCGDEWVQQFHSDRLNIHEDVPTKIPRLLPEKLIRAVLKRAEANKTYMHGPSKYPYLFSRMVGCGHCGSPMYCHCVEGIRYYSHQFRMKNCLGSSVNADDLEQVVMRHLFLCFGNPEAVQRAIDAATPNLDRVKDALQRQRRIAGELEKVQAGINFAMSQVEKGNLTEQQAEEKLSEWKKRKRKLDSEAEKLADEIENAPSPDEVQRVAKRLAEWVKGRKLTNAGLIAKKEIANYAFDRMTWDEKRKLCQAVFSGKRADGRRMGIYIERLDGEKKGKQHRKWAYTIHGHLICESGVIPRTDKQLEAEYGEGGAFLQKELLQLLSSSESS